MLGRKKKKAFSAMDAHTFSKHGKKDLKTHLLTMVEFMQ
jgi:hypothetical protein